MGALRALRLPLAPAVLAFLVALRFRVLAFVAYSLSSGLCTEPIKSLETRVYRAVVRMDR